MATGLLRRVTNLLIGFNPLFLESLEYTLESVCSEALQNTLSDMGLTEATLNEPGQELNRKKATYSAAREVLTTIQTIYLGMPKRRRMEVGVEVEFEDFSKGLALLTKTYDQVLSKIEQDLDSGVQTYTIRPLE